MFSLSALWLFVALLAVHWVADFVLQSHWMAVNKSKRLDALSLHVAAYTATLAGATVVLVGLTQAALVFVLVNGALHFVTDFITSRVTAHLWKQERVHDFFVVVGVDQLMHQLALVVTMAMILQPST